MRSFILSIMMLTCSCLEYDYSGNILDHSGFIESSPIVNDTVTDRFYKPEMRPANILIAIDKSCSMSDEQVYLWDNMDEFVSILNKNNIDYRIGVFSAGSNLTDTLGVLPNIIFSSNQWVTPSDENPGSMLQAQLSWSPGSVESGIDAMYGAIKYNYEANIPFWRVGSPLHLITISDEEDQSVHVNSSQLLRAINEYEDNHGTIVTYSSVITFPNQLNNCDDTLTTVGYKYWALTLVLGGEAIDICQDDWADALNDIAYLATDVPHEYILRSIPVVGTIIVRVESGNITFVLSEEEWYYEQVKNSVTFYKYQPGSNDVVVIKYTKDMTK